MRKSIHTTAKILKRIFSKGWRLGLQISAAAAFTLAALDSGGYQMLSFLVGIGVGVFLFFVIMYLRKGLP